MAQQAKAVAQSQSGDEPKAALQPPKKAGPKPSAPGGVSQPPLPSKGLQAQAQSLKTPQAGGQAPASVPGGTQVWVKSFAPAASVGMRNGFGIGIHLRFPEQLFPNYNLQPYIN